MQSGDSMQDNSANSGFWEGLHSPTPSQIIERSSSPSQHQSDPPPKLIDQYGRFDKEQYEFNFYVFSMDSVDGMWTTPHGSVITPKSFTEFRERDPAKIRALASLLPESGPLQIPPELQRVFVWYSRRVVVQFEGGLGWTLTQRDTSPSWSWFGGTQSKVHDVLHLRLFQETGALVNVFTFRNCEFPIICKFPDKTHEARGARQVVQIILSSGRYVEVTGDDDSQLRQFERLVKNGLQFNETIREVLTPFSALSSLTSSPFGSVDVHVTHENGKRENWTNCIVAAYFAPETNEIVVGIKAGRHETTRERRKWRVIIGDPPVIVASDRSERDGTPLITAFVVRAIELPRASNLGQSSAVIRIGTEMPLRELQVASRGVADVFYRALEKLQTLYSPVVSDTNPESPSPLQTPLSRIRRSSYAPGMRKTVSWREDHASPSSPQRRSSEKQQEAQTNTEICESVDAVALPLLTQKLSATFAELVNSLADDYFARLSASATLLEDTRQLLIEEHAQRMAAEKVIPMASEEAALKAKEEAQILAQEEAALKAKEEAQRLVQEGAALKAKEEAQRLAQEGAALKAKEEAQRLVQEGAALKAKEEAQRLAQEGAALKAKEEAQRLAQEEAALKRKEEAQRLAQEEAILAHGHLLSFEAMSRLRQSDSKSGMLLVLSSTLFFRSFSLHFVVVNDAGIHWYKSEKDAERGAAVDEIPFFVTTINSRGSHFKNAAVCWPLILPSECSKATDPTIIYFGVQFYVKEKDELQFLVFGAESPQERDEWCFFITKYIRLYVTESLELAAFETFPVGADPPLHEQGVLEGEAPR